MAKTWLASGMAALVLLAAPLSAQKPEPRTTEVPVGGDERPLAGMTPEQVAAFFTLVASDPDIEAELAPMTEELFQPGEPTPGWREAGIDMLAELGAREGGLSSNLLRDEDTEVLSVTDLSGTAAPDLSGFSPLVLRAPPPGRIDERAFASFTPGVWLEMTAQRTMRGTAMCYGGMTGLTLHSKVPVTEQTMDELLPTILFVSAVDRIGSREFCIFYERAGDAYRTRTVLPDGRSLPQQDVDATVLRIMPASALSAFIRDSVPVVPEE
jgi:hypothetical protein